MRCHSSRLVASLALLFCSVDALCEPPPPGASVVSSQTLANANPDLLSRLMDAHLLDRAIEDARNGTQPTAIPPGSTPLPASLLAARPEVVIGLGVVAQNSDWIAQTAAPTPDWGDVTSAMAYAHLHRLSVDQRFALLAGTIASRRMVAPTEELLRGYERILAGDRNPQFADVQAKLFASLRTQHMAARCVAATTDVKHYLANEPRVLEVSNAPGPRANLLAVCYSMNGDAKGLLSLQVSDRKRSPLEKLGDIATIGFACAGAWDEAVKQRDQPGDDAARDVVVAQLAVFAAASVDEHATRRQILVGTPLERVLLQHTIEPAVAMACRLNGVGTFASRAGVVEACAIAIGKQLAGSRNQLRTYKSLLGALATLDADGVARVLGVLAKEESLSDSQRAVLIMELCNRRMGETARMLYRLKPVRVVSAAAGAAATGEEKESLLALAAVVRCMSNDDAQQAVALEQLRQSDDLPRSFRGTTALAQVLAALDQVDEAASLVSAAEKNLIGNDRANATAAWAAIGIHASRLGRQDLVRRALDHVVQLDRMSQEWSAAELNNAAKLWSGAGFELTAMVIMSCHRDRERLFDQYMHRGGATRILAPDIP